MTGFRERLQAFLQGKSKATVIEHSGSSAGSSANSQPSLASHLFAAQSSPQTVNNGSPSPEAIASDPPSSSPEALATESALGSGLQPRPGKTLAKRRPRSLRPLYQSWVSWTVLATIFGTTGVIGASYHTIQQMRSDLPEPEDALTYTRDGTLTIEAVDSTILQQIGPATRESLDWDDIPTQVKEAFLASEDNDFYEHEGVAYRAIARAILANIRAGEVVEGASTITQQLARIVFLDQDQTLERKLREALLAQKMEQELTKNQIFERYINLVYFGGGAYGIADAAWIYFSKSVDELTLPEIAMIVGLAPAPSEFSPLVNQEVALRRRNLVLERMEEAGYITSQEHQTAAATELALTPSTPRNLDSRFPYFTQYVRQQLPLLIDPQDVEIGGLTVETTLNPQMQELARQTVNEAIADYGPGQRFTQAALVAIDPRNGHIHAMVGGNDFGESQFNRVVQAQRQPGSTFKTFIYATAIAGGVSPYKTYVDAKLVVDGYEPKNYGENYSGNQSMRDALIRSINIIAVKVLIEVGFDPAIAMAERMGIRSPLIPAYSLALGSVEVNLLELTGAYGTLATSGTHIEPHGITRVLNRHGEVIYEADFAAEQAIDQDSADIMTWMLRGVVTSGTGRNASLGNRPVAGKTGTSEDRRDLWFIGYVPQMVTGVWLGNDDNSPTRGASSTAARVWRNFMNPAVEELPVESFPELPQLRGREATIELQQVRPGRIQEARGPGDDASEDQATESSQDSAQEGSNERAPSSERREPSNRTSRSSPPDSPAPSPSRFERPADIEPRVEPVARPQAPAAPPPPAVPAEPVAPAPPPEPAAPVEAAPVPAPPPAPEPAPAPAPAAPPAEPPPVEAAE
ncbi:MAG: penicillin-binding protein 1A [Cyanobacteria bacterium J06638_22]